MEIAVCGEESLLAAALRLGLRWPTVCGGNGVCGTCWVLVEDGGERLSEPADAERATLQKGLKGKDPRARLACQARVMGPATVTRRGVRRSAPEDS
jgi:ferredoxin